MDLVKDGLFEPVGVEPVGDATRLRLLMSECPECGRLEFPAVDDCVACGLHTVRISEECGRLLGFTAVNYPPPGGLVEAPYSIGVACIRERLNVLGVLLADGDPSIGSALTIVAKELDDGRATFAFLVTPGTDGAL
jgi:uncharacterized OB-fold protein